jgi:uncharacterized Fe-S cluster-containing radical SAM superfamily protein
MDCDFPSATQCNLRCVYCFVETDERETRMMGSRAAEKLTQDELCEVFRQASRLGCRSAKVVGDQEPFQEEGFLDFVDFVSDSLKMWLVVFTNGSILGDDGACRHIHGMGSDRLLMHLKSKRVSIMLKYHSSSNDIENSIVRAPGYAERRNAALDHLERLGFSEPPIFATSEEKRIMTGASEHQVPDTWTRLGLESVLTPQCLGEAEHIYRMKATRRLYVDLDPPVPVGLTRSAAWRKRCGMYIPKEDIVELAIRLYSLNRELGIPFAGASPYLGGLPCSQLPYGVYVNSRGRVYPCCGCPETDNEGLSEYLGDAREPGALSRAIAANPYLKQLKERGFAYDTSPFNQSDYPGFGVYHGCPYRDRVGDILPASWEVAVEEALGGACEPSSKDGRCLA